MKLFRMLFGQKRYEEKQSLKQIQKSWSWIIGDSLASKSQPVRFSGEQLVINADPSSFSDLMLLKPAVLYGIKQKFKIKISEIKVIKK